MDNEIWKDIVGYEGHYEVSNFGRLRSNKPKFYGIMNPSYTNKGYVRYGLSLNNKQIIFTIHRLVAIHFIPNPENKPEVNHIDGDKQNNNVSNLEWCTHQENMGHAKQNGLMKYWGRSSNKYEV